MMDGGAMRAEALRAVQRRMDPSAALNLPAVLPAAKRIVYKWAKQYTGLRQRSGQPASMADGRELAC